VSPDNVAEEGDGFVRPFGAIILQDDPSEQPSRLGIHDIVRLDPVADGPKRRLGLIEKPLLIQEQCLEVVESLAKIGFGEMRRFTNKQRGGLKQTRRLVEQLKFLADGP